MPDHTVGYDPFPKINLPHAIRCIALCGAILSSKSLTLWGTKPSYSTEWGGAFCACMNHGRNTTTPKVDGLLSANSTLVLVAFFPAAYRCKTKLIFVDMTCEIETTWNYVQDSILIPRVQCSQPGRHACYRCRTNTKHMPFWNILWLGLANLSSNLFLR